MLMRRWKHKVADVRYLKSAVRQELMERYKSYQIRCQTMVYCERCTPYGFSIGLEEHLEGLWNVISGEAGGCSILFQDGECRMQMGLPVWWNRCLWGDAAYASEQGRSSLCAIWIYVLPHFQEVWWRPTQENVLQPLCMDLKIFCEICLCF